jgi:hypothetical protein
MTASPAMHMFTANVDRGIGACVCVRQQDAVHRDLAMIASMKIIMLSLVMLLGVATLAGCRRTPDDVQVREAIASLAKAAEAGSASEATAPLSDDFDGNRGELDRRSLANMIRLVALSHDRIGVTTGPITIEHRGERIVATFTVTLTSGGKWLPDQLGVYRVESAWRKDGRDWRCYTATWTHSI